jgi:hypothetical protein
MEFFTLFFSANAGHFAATGDNTMSDIPSDQQAGASGNGPKDCIIA